MLDPKQYQVKLQFVLEKTITIGAKESDLDSRIEECLEEFIGDAQQCLGAKLELNQVDTEEII